MACQTAPADGTELTSYCPPRQSERDVCEFLLAPQHQGIVTPSIIRQSAVEHGTVYTQCSSSMRLHYPGSCLTHSWAPCRDGALHRDNYEPPHQQRQRKRNCLGCGALEERWRVKASQRLRCPGTCSTTSPGDQEFAAVAAHGHGLHAFPKPTS